MIISLSSLLIYETAKLDSAHQEISDFSETGICAQLLNAISGPLSQATKCQHGLWSVCRRATAAEVSSCPPPVQRSAIRSRCSLLLSASQVMRNTFAPTLNPQFGSLTVVHSQTSQSVFPFCLNPFLLVTYRVSQCQHSVSSQHSQPTTDHTTESRNSEKLCNFLLLGDCVHCRLNGRPHRVQDPRTRPCYVLMATSWKYWPAKYFYTGFVTFSNQR